MKYVRGFGVQSPWAYAFIRYVINERYPYYAYEDLKEISSGYNKDDKKLAKLYFRLANHTQSHFWYFSNEPNAMVKAFVRAGFNKVTVGEISKSSLKTVSDNSVFVVGEQMLNQDLLSEICDVQKGKSLLVVEGIHRSKLNYAVWKSIQDDERTGVSFDLYSCGIIFFDKTRYKQHYKVNF